MEVTVTHHGALSRYEARVGEQLAGFADYRRDGGTVVFTHTEVADGYEGQGVGSRLARAALDEVRAAGQLADPRCWFIRGWIERHPEYADLVVP